MSVRPIQLLRELAFSLERAAAEEAASGAVRGAAETLRDELPNLDQQLGRLLEDLMAAASRLARGVAGLEGEAAEKKAQALAAAAMRGALEELEREWADGGMPLHDFVERLNRLIDRGARYAESRAAAFDRPHELAHGFAAGGVEGAARKVHETMPQIVEDLGRLAPLAAALASQAGQGFIAGVQQKAREDGADFSRFVEDAGRSLVRGLAAGLEDELKARPLPGADAVGRSVAAVAERTASAGLRGLAREAGRVRAETGGLRAVSRELAGGLLDALGARLKTPAFAAGAGGLALALSVFALRRR